jgi:LuxR family transcriptional regulator, quorum-sensing system regulator BjaR1
MNSDLVWSFAEACRAATSAADVHTMFFRRVEALGFAYVACASHVDPLRPPQGAVAMVNYPMEWVEHFSVSGYAQRDPVFFAAKRQILPFWWTDPAFRAGLKRDQLKILREAAEVGLGKGFTIPLHVRGAMPASCSLVAGPDGVDPLSLRDAYWLAVYAHEAARRLAPGRARVHHVTLGARERECLELVGRGKDDDTIGAILGIHKTTAHNTVQRTMRKYGVATRMQAVMRALCDGEIRIEDVAD